MLTAHTAGGAGFVHHNQHERSEWARMARALRAHGADAQAARFEAAADRHHNNPMPSREFDALQDDYRAWLVFGTVPA